MIFFWGGVVETLAKINPCGANGLSNLMVMLTALLADLARIASRLTSTACLVAVSSIGICRPARAGTKGWEGRGRDAGWRCWEQRKGGVGGCYGVKQEHRDAANALQGSSDSDIRVHALQQQSSGK